MAYWKIGGLSYLQYITLATSALRQAVKPAVNAKYLIREEMQFKQQIWKEGKPSEKVFTKVDPLAASKKNAAAAQKAADGGGGA